MVTRQLQVSCRPGKVRRWKIYVLPLSYTTKVVMLLWSVKCWSQTQTCSSQFILMMTVLFYNSYKVCPLFSCSAFSTPDILSVIFLSCIFSQPAVKTGTHYPCLGAVFTGREQKRFIDTFRPTVFINSTVTVCAIRVYGIQCYERSYSAYERVRV